MNVKESILSQNTIANQGATENEEPFSEQIMQEVERAETMTWLSPQEERALGLTREIGDHVKKLRSESADDGEVLQKIIHSLLEAKRDPNLSIFFPDALSTKGKIDALKTTQDTFPDVTKRMKEISPEISDTDLEVLHKKIQLVSLNIGSIPQSLVEKLIDTKDDAKHSLVTGQDTATIHTFFDTLVEAGHVARNRFVEANWKLVEKWAWRNTGKGVDVEDLIQDANMNGLLHAAEKYEYRKGYRFSTYAVWWIKQALSRSVANHAATIRIPVHILEGKKPLDGVIGELRNELEREPFTDEIASHSGLSEEQVRHTISPPRASVSLNALAHGDGEETVGDNIIDREAQDPETAGVVFSLKEIIRGELERLQNIETPKGVRNASQRDGLTDRDITVLSLRYGLDDNVERSYTEIGDELGFSRQRAEQLLKAALRKLHTVRFREQVEDFI